MKPAYLQDKQQLVEKLKKFLAKNESDGRAFSDESFTFDLSSRDNYWNFLDHLDKVSS